MLDKTKDYFSPKKLFALLNRLPTPRLDPFVVVSTCLPGCLSRTPFFSLVAVPVSVITPLVSSSFTSVDVSQLANCVPGGPANRVRTKLHLLYSLVDAAVERSRAV